MPRTRLTKKAITTFESIKKIDESGREYWSSRDLVKALDYADYRNFQSVLNKAKEACKNSGQEVQNHFVDITEMVSIGYAIERLSRSQSASNYQRAR